jgi:hypothetical protein
MATIEAAVRRVLGASHEDITSILQALAAKRFNGKMPAEGPFQQLSETSLRERFGLDDLQVAIVQSAQKGAGEQAARWS